PVPTLGPVPTRGPVPTPAGVPGSSAGLAPSAGPTPPTVRYVATFYDSPRTLLPKLELARSQGLAGAGFWALGYERGLPGYLELMSDFVSGRVGAGE
ncbi:MAG TPA: hypothetical protein VFW20_08445, partial [Candidatus Limnocylindrales bacterium]|nr:hypothetical protein [Candidatus Limnocylindrales bacterium]